MSHFNKLKSLLNEDRWKDAWFAEEKANKSNHPDDHYDAAVKYMHAAAEANGMGASVQEMSYRNKAAIHLKKSGKSEIAKEHLPSVGRPHNYSMDY